MDVTSFQTVVKFIVQTKATKSFFMPGTEVVNNVRIYNGIRAEKARLLCSVLKNENLIINLRKCNKCVQIDSCIAGVKCVISSQILGVGTGKTLLFHTNSGVVMIPIHQRFTEQVNRFYNIVHFDDEIFLRFRDWFLKKSTSMALLNNDNIEEYAQSFLNYNGSSYVNFLYMKFVSNCDL